MSPATALAEQPDDLRLGTHVRLRHVSWHWGGGQIGTVVAVDRRATTGELRSATVVDRSGHSRQLLPDEFEVVPDDESGQLPATATALEVLDAGKQVVDDGDGVHERIGQGEDLDLKLAYLAGRVVSLDLGDLTYPGRGRVQVAPDGVADVLRSVERDHDVSSSVGATGIAVPVAVSPIVEVPADATRVDSSTGRVSSDDRDAPIDLWPTAGPTPDATPEAAFTSAPPLARCSRWDVLPCIAVTLAVISAYVFGGANSPVDVATGGVILLAAVGACLAAQWSQARRRGGRR
ncbi:hypothetical protein ACFWGN_16285 [Oerskovia sp. NPDC060338]|uniref:hypothetical protein n=1 Tax=Oerskovia sp. NPDC060338 TaxID=3347100 RepID=UPI00365467C5